MAFINYSNKGVTASALRGKFRESPSYSREPIRIYKPDDVGMGFELVDPMSFTSRHDIAEAVSGEIVGYEKASILAAKEAGTVDTRMQNKSSSADPLEWDIFEFFPDDRDIYDENGNISPEKMEQNLKAVVEWATHVGVRPAFLEGRLDENGLAYTADGEYLNKDDPAHRDNNGLRRLAIVQEIHTNTEKPHFHIMLHRVPMEYSKDKKPFAHSLYMINGSEVGENEAALKRAIQAVGLYDQLVDKNKPKAQQDPKSRSAHLASRDYDEDLISAQLKRSNELRDTYAGFSEALESAKGAVEAKLEAQQLLTEKEGELLDTQLKLNATNEELGDLRTQFGEKVGEVSEKSKRIADLEAKQKELTDAVDGLNSDLMDTHAEIERLEPFEDKFKEASALAEQRQAEIERRDEIIKKSNSELEELRAALRNFESKVNELNSELNVSKRLAEEKDGKITALNRDYGRVEANLTTVTSERDGLRSTVDKLNESVEQVRNEKQEAIRSITTEKDQVIEQLSSEVGKYKPLIEKLEDDLVQANEKLDSMPDVEKVMRENTELKSKLVKLAEYEKRLGIDVDLDIDDDKDKGKDQGNDNGPDKGNNR